MTLSEDLAAFKRAQERLSQTRNNVQVGINIPDFDLQDLISQQVGNTIISNNPTVFSASDLLTLKSRISEALTNALDTSEIGANGFFSALKNITDLSLLYNPGGVFDFVRPQSQTLGASVTRALAEVASFSTLINDYDTFIQAVPRATLDAIDNAALALTQTELEDLLAKLRPFSANFENSGAFVESDRQDILTDVDTAFGNITPDDTFPKIDQFLKDIDTAADALEVCLQDVLDQKASIEGFVDSFKTGVNLNPFTQQTFGTSVTCVENSVEKVKAAIDKDNRFESIRLQNALAQELQSVRELLDTIPGDISTKVDADPGKADYDTLRTALLAITNTNIQAAIDDLANVVAQAKIVVVRDITTDFATTVSDYTTVLSSTTTDLTSIQTAVRAYAPTITDVGEATENTVLNSNLDRFQESLVGGNFPEFSQLVSNVATFAGRLAATLAEEIELLPPEEGGKNISFQLARNIVIGVHQTDIIASRADRNEVPGAVSSLSKQDENISKAIALIEQFL